MELKITEEKEAILLSRREISANITFKGATPSKETIRKELASALKANEKLMIVKHVYSSFGSETAKVLVYQYASEEEMKKVEPKEKKKKEKAPKEEKQKKPEE